MSDNEKVTLVIASLIILWLVTVYYYEWQLRQGEKRELQLNHELNHRAIADGRLSINERRALRKIDEAKASIKRDEWGEIIDGHMPPPITLDTPVPYVPTNDPVDEHFGAYADWGLNKENG